MEWSSYQQDIHAWMAGSVATGAQAAFVEAGAGSAKSTTLAHGSKLAPERRRIFLAYGHDIAREMLKKVSGEVATTHALGLRTLPGSPKIDKHKVRNIVDSHQWWLTKAYGSELVRLVSLAKNAAIDTSPNSLKAIEQLCEDHELDIPEADRRLACIEALSVLTESNADRRTVDFDDMIYLPTVVYDEPMPGYELVMIDEAQDWNAVQMRMLGKLVGGEQRVIVVGDPFQSIYAFRGADPESMDRMREFLRRRSMDVADFRLPICYRCSRAVVKEAQAYQPWLEPWSEAPDGDVRHAVKAGAEFWREFQHGAESVLVLCRNRAPLYDLWINELARLEIRPLGMGGIFEDVAAIVRRARANGCSTLADLEAQVLTWLARSLNSDRRDALELTFSIAAQYTDSLDHLEGLLAKQKDDARTGFGNIQFSTIHGAKGREAEVVVVLNFDLIGQGAESEWQKQQERNLAYVAITRARRRLIYLTA